MNESKNTEVVTLPLRRKPWGLALFVSLIALGVSLGQSYYSHQELNTLRQEMTRYLNSAQSTQHNAKQIADTLLTSARSTDARLALLDGRISQVAGQYEALSALYQELTRHRSDWLLAETEYTLAITNQQLQLIGNLPAAITALEGLVVRLAGADRPALIGVQRAVARDLEVLKALPKFDAVGLTVKLDNLIEQIDRLPLNIDIYPLATPIVRSASEGNQANITWWERLVYDVKQSLSDLVRIRRLDKPEAILLAPEQALFLRENLKIRLLDARLALMQRDGERFHRDLVAVRAHVEQYFDRQAEATRHWCATVNSLNQVSLNLTVPDLSASLKTVQEALEKQGG